MMESMYPARMQTTQDKSFSIFEMVLIIVALMFALMGAQEYNRGDASASRLATVYSLVEDGTWYIDRPVGEPPVSFEQDTIDKVVVNGRMISSKPPVLPLVMAGEYWLMKKTLGWSLDKPEDANKIVRAMATTLAGFSYVLALVLFGKTLRMFVDDPLIRLLLLFCLAFCTQLWGYSTQINNHVPAAAMLLAAVYLGSGIAWGKLSPRSWRFFLFGLTSGLVLTLDMPATVFVAAAAVYLLASHPRQTLTWAAAGAAIPLALHLGILYETTGSLLPVQTNPAAYLYEASYWRNPQGVDALFQRKGAYLFHMTLGRCGIFSLYPILLVGMAGALRAAYKKTVQGRAQVLLGAAAFALMTAYYVFKTNNYGGEAYGFRWYIPAMPILLLMGAPVFMTLRVRWKWLFVGVMIGISFYSGFESARSPWGANLNWTNTFFLGPTYGP
jgi:hypothetical protein